MHAILEFAIAIFNYSDIPDHQHHADAHSAMSLYDRLVHRYSPSPSPQVRCVRQQKIPTVGFKNAPTVVARSILQDAEQVPPEKVVIVNSNQWYVVSNPHLGTFDTPVAVRQACATPTSTRKQDPSLLQDQNSSQGGPELCQPSKV